MRLWTGVNRAVCATTAVDLASPAINLWLQVRVKHRLQYCVSSMLLCNAVIVIFLIHLCTPLLLFPPVSSSECERYQVPRQERPPHTDPCEETLQVSLRQKLQDLTGPETPHHQFPPTCLHRDPAKDSRLELVVTSINCPKHSPVLTVLTFPFDTHPTH